MSTEEPLEPLEPLASEVHKSDQQVAIEQEQVDEERETSFQIQKQAGDVELSRSAEAAVEQVTAAIVASDPTLTEKEAEEAEAAAIEEATATATATETAAAAASGGGKTVRSGRKSRASGSGTSTAVTEEEQARKRARKTTVSTTPTSEGGATLETNVNVRLDRLRQALFRFLDLIDHRATHNSFVKALPHIDQESVEALRQQFVGQLKEAIIDESEKLIESNELESKLASLHRLVQEAETRYQAGYTDDANEIRDVWRQNLDLQTAISARAIPDQERRINQLKSELQLVRKQNQTIHAELINTKARCDAIQNDAKDSLDALDSAIKGLEATPEIQKQLRQTMDDLLQDLGARV